MRREELYLKDIVEAAESIHSFIHDVEKNDFVNNDLVRSAVLHKLTIIGEAAARLPKDFLNRHAEIEWSDIVAFRNIAVHAYFVVDWSIVWYTTTHDVPDLQGLVAQIIATEYPETKD
jgi:uncharacterized protein with HEPN domain